MDTKLEGDKGETLAYNHLKNKGYKILQTNYKCYSGEIDIVAKDKDTYVFVEVKTRSSLRFGLPQEAINYPKMLHIKRSAENYLKYHRLLGLVSVRFDCVAILFDQNGNSQIDHIENIF